MARKKNIQLDLTEDEKKQFKAQKIKKKDILELGVEELNSKLELSKKRVKEIYALADFQQISSVGIKFANDLIFLGYYSIEEIKGRDGAQLTNQYEKKKGFKTDPCVEDQFRLAVYYSENRDTEKNWWDFTEERKKYRKEHGYPTNRPNKNWTEA